MRFNVHPCIISINYLFQQNSYTICVVSDDVTKSVGERGGSMVECRTPEREVGGSKPTAAVLCPWARHFTPRKYWLITQEAVAPSRHDWKIVDWDVKPQHKQTNKQTKSVEVRYRKACKLLCINSLSFDSLVDLHFRLQTVFNQSLNLWGHQRKMSFFIHNFHAWFWR